MTTTHAPEKMKKQIDFDQLLQIEIGQTHSKCVVKAEAQRNPGEIAADLLHLLQSSLRSAQSHFVSNSDVQSRPLLLLRP